MWDGCKSRHQLAARAVHPLDASCHRIGRNGIDNFIGSRRRDIMLSNWVDRVFLCTPDKDLQSNNVSGDRVVRPAGANGAQRPTSAISSVYPPASIPDWLALVGDAARQLQAYVVGSASRRRLCWRATAHIKAIQRMLPPGTSRCAARQNSRNTGGANGLSPLVPGPGDPAH
jgi:hypothetical protein